MDRNHDWNKMSNNEDNGEREDDKLQMNNDSRRYM